MQLFCLRKSWGDRTEINIKIGALGGQKKKKKKKKKNVFFVEKNLIFF
jgi:hypothetical protein